MGGVRHVMPRTYIAFLVGSLALVGIPPFSGFFSKDPIIASALASGGYGVALGVAALLGALLTGIYTFRLLFIVFLGNRRRSSSTRATRHAERPSMARGRGR